MFSTSRNKYSSLVLKLCKSNQETSEKVLFIKARQISRQNIFYRGLMLKLDKSLIEAESVKNYEIRIFRFDFTRIYEYLCRVFFLTTLDIYKNYFKGRQRWCNLMQSHCASKLWPETNFSPIHHILSKSYCVFTPRVLWPRSFLIFIVIWTKELCSQHLP